MSIDLLEEIYEDFKDDDGLATLEEKLHKEVTDEVFERVYQASLIKLCRDVQVVEISELEELVTNRAKSILLYLELEKFISKSRVTISKSIKYSSEKDKIVKTKMEIEVK